MQMFLKFIESNEGKHPEFLKDMVSRIDSSFFAPLRQASDVGAPDEFVATYKNLINKLTDINPKMPYKADYQKQKAAIGQAKDRLLREKKEKIRLVEKDVKRGVTNAAGLTALVYLGLYGFCLLTIGWAAWVRLLLGIFCVVPVVSWVSLAIADSGDESKSRAIVAFYPLTGFAFSILLVLLGETDAIWGVIVVAVVYLGLYGLCLLAIGWALWVRLLLGIFCVVAVVLWVSSAITDSGDASKSRAIVAFSSVGVALWSVIDPESAMWGVIAAAVVCGLIWLSRVTDLSTTSALLTPEEKSAYKTSLDNIDKYFHERENYEIANILLKSLTSGQVSLSHKRKMSRVITDQARSKDLSIITGAQGRHRGAVNSVCFSPDGKILASGSNDSTIILWDAEIGTRRRVLKGHTRPVNSVCFSPDGKILASGDGDRTIILWDAETGKQRAVLKGHAEPVNSVCFSPDGKILASGSSDKYDSTIILWDAETGKQRAALNAGSVYSVCFSPDGKILASGGRDSTILLWDAGTGKQRAVLKGHTDAVRSVCFSPDGKILASGSDDKIIMLWDVETGRAARKLENGDLVLSLCFSPDGDKLASGLYNGTVQMIW